MNWGVKILIGMGTFMLFIVAMVIYMFKVHGDDALIDDNYYEKGINYNVEYNAKKNVLDSDVAPIVEISKSQLIIKMKYFTRYKLVLIRPSAAKQDTTQAGNTVGDANLILVDTKQLGKGLWFLRLSWQDSGKEYLHQQEVIL